MIEVQVRPLAVNAIAPEQEQIDAGQPAAAKVIVTFAQIIPVGNGQGAQIPMGNILFDLDKDALANLIPVLQEAHDKLPAPSRVEVATSLGQADQVANQIGNLRGPQS